MSVLALALVDLIEGQSTSISQLNDQTIVASLREGICLPVLYTSSAGLAAAARCVCASEVFTGVVVMYILLLLEYMIALVACMQLHCDSNSDILLLLEYMIHVYHLWHACMQLHCDSNSDILLLLEYMIALVACMQ
jgi:hypothetical protein